MRISEIKIGDRFRKDLGNLKSLKNSILEIELLHPIVIDERNNLIAGRRRIEAFKELGHHSIPATIVNLGDIQKGEVHENTVRKDFTSTEIIAIDEAFRDKLNHQGERTDLTSSQREEVKDSQDIIAEYAGTSHTTLGRLREIVEEAKNNPKFEQLLEDIDKKGNKQTVNSVHLKLTKLKNKRIIDEQTKSTQITLPDTITLHNKPFQQVQIPDNSVSLIFTDPPYHDEFLPLFKDLAIQAIKVLRDGGSLVTFVGQKNIPQICNYMIEQGLEFHWPLAIIHHGHATSVHASRTMVEWKPMLWFTKGKYQGDYVRDLVDSEPGDKDKHEWAQGLPEADYYIKHMTIENEIVYDPFMGSGTFGISAIKQNRQFIGCEIDLERFEIGRNNIGNNS